MLYTVGELWSIARAGAAFDSFYQFFEYTIFGLEPFAS